jgi:ankyrin repeat protein
MATVADLADAVKASDAARVRVLLHSQPELIHIDMSGGDERRALHFAVLQRDAAMVKLLMEAGADARKGVWPHRAATSPLTLARDREYHEIVDIIEREENLRRAELSCPNATVSPIQDQINAAISQGDRETAIRLLETDRTLIQACDRRGRTPLHAAADEGDEEMVRWLVERRAKVNHPDIHGLLPLDLAALAADPRNDVAPRFPAVAQFLLGNGARLTVRAAVALGLTDRLKALLKEQPELLRAIEPNGGLLTLAVKHGQLETARLLLDLGADVDERLQLKELEQPTLTWGMPLWYAALANHLEMTELLLNRGADPNANVYASGWPLRNARNHKDDRVKRLLLARGARPHPYMVAENHDVAEARRLLESTPSVETINELAWSAADHACPEILALALPRLNMPPSDPGWHWILLQPIRGAELDDPSKHEAFVACLKLIMERGVDPNIARKGETMLHFAAARPGGEISARFAATLLDHGARLDVRDDLLKSTPLGWACRWGRKELVRTLLDRGASPYEPDAEPWATPLAWARKMNHSEIVALLEEPIM